MEQHIKITLIESNRLALELLKTFLNKIPTFTVVSDYSSGKDFLKDYRAYEKPDIVLLDLKLNDSDGKHLISQFRERLFDLKIILKTSYYEINYIGFMVKHGINAYLPDIYSPNELKKIIEKVNHKGYFLTEEQMEKLRGQISPNAPAWPESVKEQFTAREIEILELLSFQLTAKEIGQKLFLSQKTIETHKANLLTKTGSKNVVGLIIFAIQNKLINLKEIPV